jgi:hypothetical protein
MRVGIHNGIRSGDRPLNRRFKMKVILITLALMASTSALAAKHGLNFAEPIQLKPVVMKEKLPGNLSALFNGINIESKLAQKKAVGELKVMVSRYVL